MAPSDHPPFLGPLHAVLEIDWKQLTQLSPDRRRHWVQFPALPTQARLAGLSFGEHFEAFAQPIPTTWTATAWLQHGPLLTSGVGASDQPATALPAGELPAPFFFGMPVGDGTFSLSIEVQGRALPAVVTGTSLTTVTVAGEGLTLSIATNDRGPFVVGIPLGTYTPAQVVALLEAQTNVDPAASLNASNQLVLTSGTTGASAGLTIVGGTAMGALGLTAGTWNGSASPAQPARVYGTADLTALASVPYGLSFAFRTDDRGPFAVTFNLTPMSYGNVLSQIAAATNTDPMLNGDVFTSANTGASAFLLFSGNAASLLGLPSTKTYGTDATPASAPGATMDSSFSFTGLNGETLTLLASGGTLVDVTFGGLTGSSTASDVLAAVTSAIATTTGADVTASLNGGQQLVITTVGTGLATTLTIGGTATALLLQGTYNGSDPTTAQVYMPVWDIPSTAFGALSGRTLGIATDSRSTVDVTFGSPASADDVNAAILAQITADPLAFMDGNNHLVLQSGNVGASASMTIVSGYPSDPTQSMLPALGLTPTTTFGTSGSAQPATVTGTQDLSTIEYAPTGGTLNGKNLTFQTNDRGPFTVTFGTGSSAPTAPGDVVAAIQAATNTDPMVSLSASHQIVLTSQSTGSQAYVEISSPSIGGVTLAGLIGLPTGYTYGTDGGALPAEATGTQDLTTLTYPISGSLTLSTDDRAAFTVTFGASVTSAAAVVTAIANTDPAASLSTSGSPLNALVLTSASTGSTSSVTIVDGTALAALGLSTGVTNGTGTAGVSGATPATVTGTVDLTTLTYNPSGGALNGLSFTFKTDDRGPFTVTFGTGSSAPTTPGDVVTAIAAATNVDPVASLDGNGHLVLESRSKGSNASLSISGTAAPTLGLPVTSAPITGTAAPHLSAATAGHIDAHLFYFVGRGRR